MSAAGRTVSTVHDGNAPGPELAGELRRYLQSARERLVSALDGLEDYDARRPLTPTGTNLLGLVKHLIGIELGYLGECVGRPSPVRLSWTEDGSIWEGADMWAKPAESRHELVELYRRAWRHADESIDQLPLSTPAHVSWWAEGRRDTTFGSLLVRVVAETAQHAGHADIVRELIDGRAGDDHDEVGNTDWWREFHDRIQRAADTFSHG